MASNRPGRHRHRAPSTKPAISLHQRPILRSRERSQRRRATTTAPTMTQKEKLILPIQAPDPEGTKDPVSSGVVRLKVALIALRS